MGEGLGREGEARGGRGGDDVCGRRRVEVGKKYREGDEAWRIRNWIDRSCVSS